MIDSCHTVGSASRQRKQQSQTRNTNGTRAQQILIPNLRMESTGSNFLLSCVPSKYIHVIVFFVFKGKRFWLRAFPCITKPNPTSYRCLQFDTVQRNVLWFYGRSHCVHLLAHRDVFLTSLWTIRSQHVHPIKLQHALLRYLDMLLTFYQNSVKKL